MLSDPFSFLTQADQENCGGGWKLRRVRCLQLEPGSLCWGRCGQGQGVLRLLTFYPGKVSCSPHPDIQGITPGAGGAATKVSLEALQTEEKVPWSLPSLSRGSQPLLTDTGA